jgi:ABC-type transport system involved in multi-copper enzyme maturation permease subunit
MVANTELQRVGTSGWRTGLANLVHKENRAWWASRRQLVQSLLWAVFVNGFVALLVFVLLPYGREVSPTLEGFESLTTGADLLFKLGLLVLAFRTIVLAQDEILGERQLGVTEWLLSKPVSRPAYVLSKLLAHGLGVLVILVGLHGALGYGLLSLIMGEPFPLPPYLVGMAGLAVNTLFYLALTLMMGVLTANRPLLLGVSLGTHFGGVMAISFLAKFLGRFALLTPWSLFNALPAAVLGAPLPLSIWVPIGVTAGLTVVFVAVTLARFEQLEF